ncbi:MAG: CvpA family protein [Oscillospiraceae bacterium]|nr:CvpA family protein [Oscillospiraceae bacterium]
MSLILDIILVAVFAAFVFAAVKKGFIRTLLELVAVVAALVLAYQFSPVMSQAVFDGMLEKNITSSIETQIGDNFDATTAAKKAETALDAIPDFAVSLAETAGVNIDNIKNNISAEKLSAENVAKELVEKIAEPIVTGALTIIFFVLLSCVLIIILRIAAAKIAKLFKVPLVGTVDKLLGAVLGICRGLVVLVLICTVLEFLFANGNGELAAAVKNSTVMEILDNINPFINSLKELF